jgi:hypothetical protein
MCELKGIKPGHLFSSMLKEKKIKALYEANSDPFFDTY